MTFLCTLYADLCRLFTDMMQTNIKMCIWYTDKWQFPHYALALKNLRGVTEMDLCWLLPYALTGRKAGACEDQG